MKVTQDALLVEASAVSARPWSRGGADSSLENNNVFFSEPKVYVEGTNPEDPFNEDLNAKGGSTTANAATGEWDTLRCTAVVHKCWEGLVGAKTRFLCAVLAPFDVTASMHISARVMTHRTASAALVALLGVAVLSVAGTAVLIFYEQYIGLGVFWLAIFGGVAAYAYNTVLSKEVNN